MNFKIDTKKKAPDSSIEISVPTTMVYDGTMDGVIAMFEIEIFKGEVIRKDGNTTFRFECDDERKVSMFKNAILTVALKINDGLREN